MKADRVKMFVAERNPDALFADGFEDALIGVGLRCAQPSVAIYDYDRAIRVLIERDGISFEEAHEHMGFNVLGCWAGPNTPLWLMKPDEDEDEDPT